MLSAAICYCFLCSDRAPFPRFHHDFSIPRIRLLVEVFFYFNMKSSPKSGCCPLMPVYGRAKSSSRFCIFPEVQSTCNSPSSSPVYLNVYDLTHLNGYVYWAGFGVFHTGVEVHGVEYAFGAHDYSTSGVFELEPRQCPGFKFRRSIFIGTTCMDPDQVREFMELQSTYYAGDTYNLISRNCNHFCEDICFTLTGNHIPKWVNRLARIGSVCEFMLPETLKASDVGEGAKSSGSEKEKKKGSAFSGFFSISMSQREKEAAVSSELLHIPPPELKPCSSVKKE